MYKNTSIVIWSTHIIVPKRPIGTAIAIAASGFTPAAIASAVPNVPASPGSVGGAPPAEIYAINGN